MNGKTLKMMDRIQTNDEGSQTKLYRQARRSTRNLVDKADLSTRCHAAKL